MANLLEPKTAPQIRVTDSQIKLLKEFTYALRDIHPRDDRSFRWAISMGAGLLNLTHQDIAETFSVSRPTVTRWINGQNSPHPAVRPTIYKWMIDQSEEAIKENQERLEVVAA